MLNVLEDTRELKYTVEELNAKDWVKLDPGHPYQLLRTISPYEQLIEEIYAHESSVKIKAVDHLITSIWAPGDGSHNLAMSLKKDMEKKMKELKKSETLRQQTRKLLRKHIAKNKETKAKLTNMRAMTNEPLHLPDPS